ncbi:T9SS type A sorting domain-containing protein [Fluviicola taffensis]|uniref:T9SS type A sorting domain-containing protein n=1 Tax=Fluviicola taffensis TaxID=191579 RepID=UPI003137C3D5
MKKLLTLIVVFVSTFSFSQGWNYIGSSTGIANATEVDIEVTPGGNLYAAYIDASNSNKITVRKWLASNSTWQLVGTAGIGDANVFDLQLVVLGETTPVVAAKTFYQTTYEFLEIYKFNGTSWISQAIGSGGYNQIEHSYDYSLRGNTANQLFLTFYNVDEQSTGYSPENALITVNMTNQTLYGGASPNLEQTSFSGELSSYIDGNNAYVIHGEADMSDYIPFDVSVNGAAYSNNTLDNSDGASKMLIEKNNGATAYSSVWAVPYSTFPLKFRSFNGTAFGTQANISTGANVVDFDFDTYNSDAYVFYKTTSCFFKKVTNVASPAISTISSGTTLAPATATSLEMEVSNYGVYVIAYVDGGKFYVKEYNQLANIEDYDLFAMCESSVFNNSASNSVYCLDPNFSQQGLTMTCVSQNVGIIPNSAITVTGAGTLSFSLNINNTNDVSSPTIVDLQFELFDNGVSCGTALIPITVNPKPVIVFTNPTNAVCENANPINLNNWANPSGGTWSGTGVLNNTFYPSYPTVSPVMMNYTKTNQFGCTSSASAPLTINQTPDLNVTTSTSNCNQNTGTASVAITNGQSPYSIYWSTGSTLDSVSNLAPGQYLVSVTDANGCLSTSTSMVGSNGISQAGVPTGALCYGTTNGAINVTVTGGAAPLVYAWSNGATTEDITGLVGGPYELTITDALGCVSTATYTVQEPQQIMLNTMTVTQPGCSATNGQVTASFNGGTSPFNYAWVNGQGTPVGTNNATLSSIGAGTYTCTITDANGCAFSSAALVSNNFGPTLAIDTIIPSSCSNDGQIQLTVISGNPTAYLWTNGATTQNITNLSPGTYSVSVTGGSGCITVLGGTVESTLPDPIDICLVTVDSTTNTNLVVWEKPITTGIDHFNIYRETSQAGLYQLVGSVLYSDESIYNDIVASPNVRSWRYRISSVDDCGNESELSSIHKTIHLVISHGLGNDINLFWDSYEGFAYTNFILRRHTDAAGWTPLATMPNNLFTYTDQPSTTDGLFYEVTVAAPSLCSSTKMAQDFNTTRSNRDNRLSTGQPNSVSELLDQVVNIYPNPANTVLNVDNSSSQLIEARILDQTGRVISSTTLAPGQTKIDCGKLAMGMYSIELQSLGAKTLKRFVIER